MLLTQVNIQKFGPHSYVTVHLMDLKPYLRVVHFVNMAYHNVVKYLKQYLYFHDDPQLYPQLEDDVFPQYKYRLNQLIQYFHLHGLRFDAEIHYECQEFDHLPHSINKMKYFLCYGQPHQKLHVINGLPVYFRILVGVKFFQLIHHHLQPMFQF